MSADTPDCIGDFEEQRERYEACVYGIVFGVLLMIGLPIRLCLPSEIREVFSRQRTPEQLSPEHRLTAKIFHIWTCALSALGVIGFLLSVLMLFPRCHLDGVNCTTKASCNVCGTYLDGIYVGNCYKFARQCG